MSKLRERRNTANRSSWDIYLRLLRIAKRHWRVAAAAIVAMIATAGTETSFAWIIKPMIDGSFVKQDPTIIKLVPLGLIAIFIVRGAANFVSSYGLSWVGRQIIKTLRGATFDRILRMPTSFFDDSSPGILLSKLTYDVEQVATAATSAVTTLVRDSFTVIFLMGYMFYISPWLALIFLGLGPVVMIIIMSISKRFRRLSRRIQISVGDVAQVAEDAVHGHVVIKTFGAQAYEKGRFERANERNRSQAMKYVATRAFSTPFVQFLAACALALVVYLATLAQIRETITAGTFVSFIAAMLLLMQPLKRLTDVNSQLQRGIAAGESIFDLLDEEPEPDHGTLSIDRARGDIRYEDVSFAYKEDGETVLKDVNLAIGSGETVALVGRSGSGKSTLVSLLPRFYQVRQGRILLDGQPIADYPLDDLRRQIAIVSQQVVLFNDTLAANIAYGDKENLDMEAIRDAAEAAHALEFIERLPEGFDTVIGENGVMLSGGQRQRLAIARALYKNAPILILDEATSALDSEAEKHIQSALEGLMRSRTTLVIAHRLSTIENADRIVVLDQGRVVEEGGHSELLEKDGHYAALHRIQFREASARAAHV